MTEPRLLREHERIYRCPFCRRSWRRRARGRAEEHIVGCLERPDRHPFAAELTTARQAGRLVIVEPMPNGEVDARCFREGGEVPAGVWIEWVPREMPAWWPGPGKMWDGLAWVAIPGWSQTTEPGPHGLVGKAPPIDVWPKVDGVPLDQMKGGERLLAVLRGEVR